MPPDLAERIDATIGDSNAIIGDSKLIAPIVVPLPIKIEEHNSGDEPTLGDNHS